MRTHGKASTYGSGCRCDLCTEATRLYMREHRKRMKDLGRPFDRTIRTRAQTRLSHEFCERFQELLTEEWEKVGGRRKPGRPPTVVPSEVDA